MIGAKAFVIKHGFKSAVRRDDRKRSPLGFELPTSVHGALQKIVTSLPAQRLFYQAADGFGARRQAILLLSPRVQRFNHGPFNADVHSSAVDAIPQPSRRALVAGLAIAPIAGVPAVAGAIAGAPMSKALAQAIERHKIAVAAFDAQSGETDEIINPLGITEWHALDALAKTPCASEAELIEKLRYLLTYEKRIMQRAPSRSVDEFGAVLVALDFHLNGKA